MKTHRILGCFVALGFFGVVGCSAAPDGDDTAAVSSSSSALSLDAPQADAMPTGAGLIGGMSMKVAKSVGADTSKLKAFDANFYLFAPPTTIDVDALLAGVDEKVRAIIVKTVLDDNKARLASGLAALADAETAIEFIGQKDARTAAQIYESLSTSVNVQLAEGVMDRITTSSDPVIRSAGLPLYVAAAQIKATKLAIMIKLLGSPTDKGLLAKHLHRALAESNPEAVRATDLAMRLGKVTACKAYENRRPFQATEWKSDVEDSGSRIASWTAPNEDAANERCTQFRRQYVVDVTAKTMKSLDVRFAFATEVRKVWLASVEKMDGQIADERFTTTDLGGMYGYSSMMNPYTGGLSCPSGYIASDFAGEFNVDYPATQCVRRNNGTLEPVADFGGMYGSFSYWDGAGDYVNSVTGKASCPAGYDASLVMKANVDFPLYLCSKKHVAGTKERWLFGGVYSNDGGAGYVNPSTGAKSCPAGFTPKLVHGAWNDRDIVSCIKDTVDTRTDANKYAELADLTTGGLLGGACEAAIKESLRASASSSAPVCGAVSAAVSKAIVAGQCPFADGVSGTDRAAGAAKSVALLPYRAISTSVGCTE